ncbi:hypothetical protein [Sphingomonas sp.]|uniref:hypothetical protein n=1 Tax=Sphingomonas sp. TaxID=28214 RepID=UPI003D6D4BD9
MGKIWKSIRAGVDAYKNWAYLLGLLMATISIVNLLVNIVSFEPVWFIKAVLAAYHEVISDPIRNILRLFGVSVPLWAIDAAVLYVAVGTSVARTQRDYFKYHRFQSQSQTSAGWRLFGFKAPRQTWRAFKILITRNAKLAWQNPTPRITLLVRISLFYAFLPNIGRLLFDILLWPASIALLFDAPYLVTIDNGQNPEDNGAAQWSIASFKEAQVPNQWSWIRVDFLHDYRFFLLGQLIGVLLATAFVMGANSAVVKLSGPVAEEKGEVNYC